MIRSAVAPFDRSNAMVHTRNARFGIRSDEARANPSEPRITL
jgi:hypothetical protein